MLSYLERCFDEKLVEFIYLSIDLLLVVQTKLWQGNSRNLCVQSDIYSLHRARTNLSAKGKKC
jgi:hypothetical protein